MKPLGPLIEIRASDRWCSARVRARWTDCWL